MGSRSNASEDSRLQRAGMNAVVALVCAAAVSVGLPAGAFSADPWLKLKTSNFELYTTAGERRGREAILHFEKVRNFFLQAGNLKSNSEVPTRIIAFGSRGEYRPYQPSEFVAAYYQPGNNGQDYIVMGTLGGETQPIAVHEYVHLLVRHSGAELPPWMNEGMAELFSTLRPIGNRVEIGGIIPGRIQALQTIKWLDLETLTAGDQDSPHRNDREQTEIFYAQSWALTHMLWLSDNYRLKLGEFLNAINSEKSSAEAFRAVYGKSLADVRKDLEGYFRQNRVNVGNYDIKLEKSAETVTTEPVKPMQSGMMLAELLVHGRKLEEGRKAYEKLAAESAQDNAEAAELLGYFAWRSLHEAEEGQRHFARAVEMGSRNAMLHFDYAMLLRRKQFDDPMVLSLLQRAVELQPDLTEARYELGVQLYQQKMYGAALGHFQQIQQVSRERAVPMFRAMAHAFHEVGDSEQARKSAEMARQYSRSPEEIAEAERLLEYLSYGPERQPGTEPESIATSSPTETTGGQDVSGNAEESEDEVSDAPVLRRRASPEQREPAPNPPPAASNAPVRQLPPRVPLESAEGVLQQVECLGSTARLVIDASGEERKFVIQDPNTVLIRGVDSYSVDFSCGRQEPKAVLILYEPAEQEDAGTVGVVRVIEFK